MFNYQNLKNQVDRAFWYVRYRYAKIYARKISNNNINLEVPQNILVLCYGNIYRSPFAAGYLKGLLDSTNYHIKSAGFFSKSDRKSAEQYVQLVSRYKVDLSNHQSVTVSKSLFDWANIILIMDGKNYKLALMLDSSCINKIVWLGALIEGGPVEIEDPYNMEVDQQEDIVRHMIDACRAFCSKLTSGDSTL